MNRRSFIKFLGIGSAMAAVVPNMLADDPEKLGWYTNPSPEITRQRLQSVLPNEVKISDKDWKFLKYLTEKMEKQLGVNDMKSLLRKPIQRIKRNA